jgi:hypothetical protein
MKRVFPVGTLGGPALFGADRDRFFAPSGRKAVERSTPRKKRRPGGRRSMGSPCGDRIRVERLPSVSATAGGFHADRNGLQNRLRRERRHEPGCGLQGGLHLSDTGN